jgi:hypothetical protein
MIIKYFFHCFLILFYGNATHYQTINDQLAGKCCYQEHENELLAATPEKIRLKSVCL